MWRSHFLNLFSQETYSNHGNLFNIGEDILLFEDGSDDEDVVVGISFLSSGSGGSTFIQYKNEDEDDPFEYILAMDELLHIDTLEGQEVKTIEDTLDFIQRLKLSKTTDTKTQVETIFSKQKISMMKR